MSHKRKPRDIRRNRRTTRRGCPDHLYVAPLWAAYTENLGTLLRTCDAVGACMAVPSTKHYREALNKGDTLGRLRPCVHWVRQASFIEEMKPRAHVLGVELAEGATPLALLGPARQRTVVVLGHEHRGIPEEWWGDLDEVVEIPMIGVGGSLNVAVAGSLVLYRLAGLG